MIFTDYVLEKVSSYVHFVRPKLNPTCNYLFVCKNGTQLANLGDIFRRMVYQAVGKYLNPTRYRQIIETASSEFLSPQEQDVISLDQKHTNVAKVHYQKKRSRRVAEKALDCMEKLIRSSQNENGMADNETEEEKEETEDEMEADDRDIQAILSNDTPTRRRRSTQRESNCQSTKRPSKRW